jgi:hypothetical protein
MVFAPYGKVQMLGREGRGWGGLNAILMGGGKSDVFTKGRRAK